MKWFWIWTQFHRTLHNEYRAKMFGISNKSFGLEYSNLRRWLGIVIIDFIDCNPTCLSNFHIIVSINTVIWISIWLPQTRFHTDSFRILITSICHTCYRLRKRSDGCIFAISSLRKDEISWQVKSCHKIITFNLNNNYLDHMTHTERTNLLEHYWLFYLRVLIHHHANIYEQWKCLELIII